MKISFRYLVCVIGITICTLFVLGQTCAAGEIEVKIDQGILKLKKIESEINQQLQEQLRYLEHHPSVPDPPFRPQYSLKIVKPTPNVNYEIMNITPDPNTDFKLIVVDPNTRQFPNVKSNLFKRIVPKFKKGKKNK
jgi:hypothetical protein